jgi:hypothetical protein
MSDEIQFILSGKSPVKHGTIIQTIISYLEAGQGTSEMVERDKHFKKEETKRLKDYIITNKLVIYNINSDNYVSEGAEQKVYLKDGSSVLKLNDAIYYLSWIDYFHNLLLHNYFFPDTAYKLLGFTEENDVLYAVVEQNFVKANQKTDLQLVKEFMVANDFQNTRNNDYMNNKLGVILEDLHDENVLTQDGILFFIDTVFYVLKK